MYASNRDTISSESAVEELRSRRLLLPVSSTDPEQWKESFYQKRGERLHEAADMLAPRDTPIHAVEDGVIARMSWNAKGGNTIYQKDSTGRYSYYYAHLQRYEEGITAGDFVRRGQIIGYVGTTGNAPPNCPHLHFSIERCSTAEAISGVAIDPYQVFAAAPLAPDLRASMSAINGRSDSNARRAAPAGTVSQLVTSSPAPWPRGSQFGCVAPYASQLASHTHQLPGLVPAGQRPAGVSGFPLSGPGGRSARGIGLKSTRHVFRNWLSQKTRKWLQLGLR